MESEQRRAHTGGSQQPQNRQDLNSADLGACSTNQPTGLQGVVVGISGDRVDVRIGVQKCQGCGHSGTCALLLQGQESYVLQGKTRDALRQGELVSVLFSGPVKVKTACLLYLCPSISTVLGGALGSEWLPNLIGVSPSVGGLIGVLLLLPLGLVPAWLENRRGGHLPQVVKLRKEE